MTAASAITLLPIGFVFLLYGAKLLCDSAIAVSKNLKFNSPIVSVFLVSLGTAAPDCASELISILKGEPNMAVGGILGCNFANLTLGLGIASMFAPFMCSKDMARLELPLLALLDTLFVGFCLHGKLVRSEGIIFLISLVAYVIYSFSKRKSSVSTVNSIPGQHAKDWNIWQSIIVFVVSASMLAGGAYIAVESCTAIADWMGVSKTFIGFSLLAFGNSAPEIFVVSTAALRKQHAICAGNIICSNLINLTFVAGMCALINPVYFNDREFFIEALSSVSMSYITWLIFSTKKLFSRAIGVFYIGIYIAVMVSRLCLRQFPI